MSPSGDTKSRHVRSSGGRSSRTRGYSYRSTSRSYSYAAPSYTKEQLAEMDRKLAEERLARQQAEVDRIELLQSQSVRLTGHLHSEIATAIASRERYGLMEGDFLDDPVEASQGRAGFGEDYTVSRGVRLLVNLCIDCSNSMTHNGVADVTRQATLTLYAMLDNVARLLPPETLAVNVWQWARGKDGSGVYPVTPDRYSNNPLLTAQQSVVDSINSIYMDGEDTYIAPLFRALHYYEQANNWSGEARLDIILTDGVLEHKKDRNEAGNWQQERDGGLNTVMLNFLPIADWAEVYLPDRCFQYEANVDNVFTLMTKVLGEWVMLL